MFYFDSGINEKDQKTTQLVLKIYKENINKIKSSSP